MTPLDRRDYLKMMAVALSAVAPRGGAASVHRDNAEAPLIRLSLNESSYGPSPAAIEAVRREMGNLCRYTREGYTRLRSSIAAKEGVSEQQVVLGEVLAPLGAHLAGLGGVGAEFVYSNPGYTALIDAAAARGGVAVPVPLSDALQNDLPAIAERVGARTQALFLVNPHNPTGTVTDAALLRDFARDVSRRTLLIVDEAYLEYDHDFEQRTLSDLVREGAQVIVFRTFAKIHGLAGLEIGYGLVPVENARELQRQGLDDAHRFNRLAVAAASASLADRDHVKHVAAAVAHERRIWAEQLRRWGVQHSDSHGNFVFFETGLDHADFSARMLQAGVEIGRKFPPYDRWARISIGLPAENLRARAAVQASLHR